MKVTLGKGTEVEILGFVEREYTDGNKAVMLKLGYDDGYTEELALSCNMPEMADHLEEGQFFMKGWSENEKFAEAVLEAGLVKTTGKTVRAGYAVAPICELTDKAQILAVK